MAIIERHLEWRMRERDIESWHENKSDVQDVFNSLLSQGQGYIEQAQAIAINAGHECIRDFLEDVLKEIRYWQTLDAKSWNTVFDEDDIDEMVNL